ncbi:hypothetical protein B0H14DRAFT_3162833 [Mycena olivaceomarginata]|nr:hypothetical protein B0H14DRAFT_3162833 [Mycena olivaceomarginata]
MQESSSTDSGFGSSQDGPSEWEFLGPHSSFTHNEVVANNPFDIHYPLSLDQLHQRLLWVETTVLGWQLIGDQPAKPTMGRNDEDHVRTTPPLTCTQDSTTCENKETTKAIVRRSRRAHNAKPLKASKIAKVLDERRRGRGWQYRVRLVGGGFNDCSWIPGRKLKVDGVEALSIWEKQKQLKALTL